MKKRILVVDDDPDIVFAITVMLQDAGYDVSSSLNGKYVLEGGYQYPDLYLLDKRIPDIDGIEICRHLRSNAATRHIPVIMVSASPKFGKQALEAGANDFLEKPFDMKALLQLIQKYIL